MHSRYSSQQAYHIYLTWHTSQMDRFTEQFSKACDKIITILQFLSQEFAESTTVNTSA